MRRIGISSDIRPDITVSSKHTRSSKIYHATAATVLDSIGRIDYADYCEVGRIRRRQHFVGHRAAQFPTLQGGRALRGAATAPCAVWQLEFSLQSELVCSWVCHSCLSRPPSRLQHWLAARSVPGWLITAALCRKRHRNTKRCGSNLPRVL